MWRSCGPPSEVGVLPIPKVLKANTTTGATKATHYSTPEFCEYHLSRIVQLLNIVIPLAIGTEAGRLPSPPTRPPSGQLRISGGKVCLTKQITVRQFKLGPFSTH